MQNSPVSVGNIFFHNPKFFIALPAKSMDNKEAQMALAYSGSRGFTGSEAPRI